MQIYLIVNFFLDHILCCVLEEESISLESCRSYIALVTDNKGPPEISTEDAASFLKLILFVRVSLDQFFRSTFSLLQHLFCKN